MGKQVRSACRDRAAIWRADAIRERRRKAALRAALLAATTLFYAGIAAIVFLTLQGAL